MVTNMFQLKSPVGPEYNHDLDDVLKTKRTLKDLGHFKTPKYGMTEFPDQQLFGAVKGFQRDRGLKEDGIMRPGGPTEAALDSAMAQKADRMQRGPSTAKAETLPARPDVDATPRPRLLADTAGESDATETSQQSEAPTPSAPKLPDEPQTAMVRKKPGSTFGQHRLPQGLGGGGFGLRSGTGKPTVPPKPDAGVFGNDKKKLDGFNQWWNKQGRNKADEIGRSRGKPAPADSYIWKNLKKGNKPGKGADKEKPKSATQPRKNSKKSANFWPLACYTKALVTPL